MTRTSRPRARSDAPWLVGLLVVVVALVAAMPDAGARGATGRAAVSSESRRAAQAGVAILRRGGNAVDAAVTTALVAGVTHPTSSGIGGGGFVLAWDAKSKKVLAIDFRETAPAAIDAAVFERRPLPVAERGALVGTPGEVAGLFDLHRRLGKLPWADVVTPAAQVAERGYAISRHMANTLSWVAPNIAPDVGLSKLFLRRGKGLSFGAHVKNPALGRTLRRIAAEGSKAFYEGAVAADMVSAAQEAGGTLGLDDLAKYRPVERQPITVRWEGYEVHTMGPPSAGGLMLAQTLTMFSRRELKRLGFNTPAYQHMIAESMRAAIADRMRYVGDPGHQRVDLDVLLSPKRLARRKASLGLDRTHAQPRFGLEEHGTHHLVTADGAGNMVSLTTTVNRAFGARVSAPNAGVVLNDELDDFTSVAGVKQFGMKQSPNRARPAAKPVSSMTPTIVVKDGRAVFGLGGSGGMKIATNVTQVVLGRLAFGHSPGRAVSARRFSTPTKGAYISLEEGDRPKHVEDLERRGEIVTVRRAGSDAVQAIAVEAGKVIVAADPRKYGTAIAY